MHVFAYRLSFSARSLQKSQFVNPHSIFFSHMCHMHLENNLNSCRT